MSSANSEGAQGGSAANPAQDPALKALQDQIDLLTKQKELIAAQKAALQEYLPAAPEGGAPDAAAPQVEAGDSGFGFMAQLVSYRALQRCAELVAKAIGTSYKFPHKARILVVGDLDFQKGAYALIQVRSQAAFFQKEFETRLTSFRALLDQALPAQPAAPQPPPPEPVEMGEEGYREFAPPGVLEAPAALASPLGAIGAAAALAPGVLGGLATIASSFQTTFTFKSVSVSTDAQALYALIAGHIPDAEVLIENFYQIDQAPIVADFNQLFERRIHLLAGKSRLVIEKQEPLKVLVAQVDARIEKLKGDLDLSQSSSPAAAPFLKNQMIEQGSYRESLLSMQRLVEAEIAEIEALLSAFDSFKTTVTTVSADAPVSLLAQAAARDALVSNGVTHLLFLKLVTQGGEAAFKKEPFFRLNRSGVAYLGGGAIAYILAKTDGVVLAADTLAAGAEMGYRIHLEDEAQVREIKFN